MSTAANLVDNLAGWSAKQHLPCILCLAIESNIEWMKTLVYLIEFLFHASSSFRTLQKRKRGRLQRQMRQLRQQGPTHHCLK